jgi:hypothetical protein
MCVSQLCQYCNRKTVRPHTTVYYSNLNSYLLRLYRVAATGCSVHYRIIVVYRRTVLLLRVATLCIVVAWSVHVCGNAWRSGQLATVDGIRKCSVGCTLSNVSVTCLMVHICLILPFTPTSPKLSIYQICWRQAKHGKAKNNHDQKQHTGFFKMWEVATIMITVCLPQTVYMKTFYVLKQPVRIDTMCV